jgi:hypothetical protein
MRKKMTYVRNVAMKKSHTAQRSLPIRYRVT